MISRIKSFTAQHITRINIRNMFLVLMIFILIAASLRDSVHGVENSLLMLMLIGGLVIGWIIATFTKSNWVAPLITLITGSFLLTIRVGRLGSLISALLKQLVSYLVQFMSWIFQTGPNPNPESIQWGVIELGDRLGILASRLILWATNFVQGNPQYDPVAIAFVWGFLFWFSAVWAIWLIIRYHRPLAGILPALAIVSTSLVYIGKSPFRLVPIFGLAVGLIVLVHHDVKEKEWETENIPYAGIIREKISTTAVILSIGLMVFTTINPSFTIRRIVNFINRVTAENIDDEEIARSLGIEPQSETTVVDAISTARTGGLPNRHLIGSDPDLSDQPVMIIQVEELSALESDRETETDQTYYWRSLTYDRYLGSGWASRDFVEQKYKPGESTLASWPESYRIIRQKIELFEDLGGLLFSAGIPLNTDHSFQVAWRMQDANQETYDIFGATIKAENYWVDSLQPEGSKIELRSAGQEYPDWIRNRYIWLPESVPERVLALARDLTATEPTPYDRAVALETYLRKFPYTLELPQPPLDRDITDYFLFVAQKGYCDYYATAMVVLARAAGLPARMVTGYIGGYYIESQDAYLITADLAHAWAEIYFPEFGWIVFEPTGGRPALDRPSDPIPKFSRDYASSFDPLVPKKEPLVGNWTLGILISLLLAGLFGYFVFLLLDFILERLPVEKQLPIIYKRIYRYAHWIGISSKPGDTVFEFMNQLISHTEQYGYRSRNSEWLFSATFQLREITRAYYLVLYSQTPDQGINNKEIALAFRTLRFRLWYSLLLVRSHRYRILHYFLWDSAPIIVSRQPKQTQ